MKPVAQMFGGSTASSVPGVLMILMNVLTITKHHFSAVSVLLVLLLLLR